MKSLTFGLALLASTICSTVASAQDEQTDVQEQATVVEMSVVDEGDGAPMIFSSSQSFSSDGGPGQMRILSAPGMGGTFTMMGGGDGSFAMPAPNPFDMLNNPSVQKDLELVGDQLDKVKAMQSEFQKQIKDQIGDLSKGGLSPDRFKDLPAMMAKLRSEQQEQMKALLLPHQIDRLKQVALQTHMKQAGTANALTNDTVAEALKLTDKQKEKLKSRAKEIKKKLEEDTKKLKEAAKQELLDELTLDQQKTLKEMMGEKYEPKTQDWQDSFRDRIQRRSRRGGEKN
ncbi:MAG: hypothetical protein AB8B55_15745 [Mariniblastus sp.]